MALNDTRFKKGMTPWNKGLAFLGKGERHPNWKGGKPKCVDCGKQLDTYGRKRCKKCYHVFAIKENSANWRGGVTDENSEKRKCLEYKIWRNEVYKKDNWTCRICKRKCGNKEIVAHHLKLFSDFPELRFSVDNGITLCRKCHLEIHKKLWNKKTMA